MKGKNSIGIISRINFKPVYIFIFERFFQQEIDIEDVIGTGITKDGEIYIDVYEGDNEIDSSGSIPIYTVMTEVVMLMPGGQ